MRFFGAVVVLIGFTSLAHAADGDAAKGEQSFRICGACHSIGPDAKNKIGPELNGVVGRKWGSVDDYSYSADLSAGKEQGKVWDEATLDDYLQNPKHLAPHGKMSFTGFKSESQRADIMAYLKQFDDKGNKK